MLPDEMYQELIGDAAEVEQGSLEWDMARLGRCTASRFKDVRCKDVYVDMWTLTDQVIDTVGFKGTWLEILAYLEEHKNAETNAIIKNTTINSASSINTLQKKGYLKSVRVKQPYKLTGTAERYLNEILAGLDAGYPVDQFSSPATDWGNQYEPIAIKEYVDYRQKQNNPFFMVESVGFITHPNCESIGGSPDGLTNDEGGAEVKCAKLETNHMAYVRSFDDDGKLIVPKEHKDQVQGCLWLTGRKYWDFIAFNPRINGPHRLHIIREFPDKDYIDNLANDVFQFVKILNKEIKNLNL